LKTVGVLNLISQGGALRASRAVVSWALVGSEGFRTDADVCFSLERLCDAGVLTYRGFSDEYRVWQGSDFDFAAAITRVRDRLQARSPSEILEQALPLEPAVAARHSQWTGSLRYFTRHFVDVSTLERVITNSAAEADGLVLYPLDDVAVESLEQMVLTKPVLIAISKDITHLYELALETASLIEVVESDDVIATDWVARRELRERSAMAREVLLAEFHQILGNSADVTYRVLGGEVTKPAGRSLSTLLSDICDQIYDRTPIVRNEMLNRRELTSQGAKARHDLLEALVKRPKEERLGIRGYGPERAMYEAILHASGIHCQRDNEWGIGPPSTTSEFRSVWDALEDFLQSAATEAVALAAIVSRMGEAPFGMLEGPIPVLVTAWLLFHADDVAVFQDGTFQPRLGIEVIERLIKAPNRFTIRFVGVSGARKRVLERLAESIEPRPLASDVRNATVLQVLAPLVSLAHEMPAFARTTKVMIGEQAACVRDCLLTGREPGDLLFRALPEACGMKPLTSRGTSEQYVDAFVIAINDAIAEMQDAYRRLLITIERLLASRLRVSESELRSSFSARASVLSSRTLSPTLHSFLQTASDIGLDDDDWLEALAMNVTGCPPQSWGDEDVLRFEALLGGTFESFRRIEHLYYDAIDVPSEGFEVARITRTEPDGSEQGEVFWVEASHKATLQGIIDAARLEAVAKLGPRAEAALLAVHAEMLLKSVDDVNEASVGESGLLLAANGD
jgi:hypothetical protein